MATPPVIPKIKDITKVNDPGYSVSTSNPGVGGLNPNQRDAYSYLVQIFNSYGLSSLAPEILKYVQQGYQSDTISLLLQETSAYKKRFKANDERAKKGLGVLSPAEYISLESSYRQVLSSQGLPQGFYDSPDDFAVWIGGDVSPAEIQERAQIAGEAVANTDPQYLQSLRDYGLGQGDLVASILDRKRALPLLQKTVREAQIGAEARRQGLSLTANRAGYFESLGVTQQAAQQAYQAIGQNLGTLENLGSIYDEGFTQTDFEDELLGNSGLASQKRARLQSRETGNFSGSSSVGQKTLGSQSRGSF